jgi:acyl-lipid omega-6 desaturase (Delta-12 desaturase)
MEAYSASGAGAVDVAQAASSVHQRSLSRGLFIFATYFFLYAVTLIDALAPFPVPVNIVAGIANGVCIAMLFIVAHDCGHGAFVPGRRWNLWLGRLSFVPVVHSISLWRLAHNHNHHGRTNLKGVDPVWTPMSPADYAAAPAARRWLERVYRSAIGPVVYYYYDIWLKLMLFPVWPQARTQWRKHVPDTIFVLIGFAATIAGICLVGTHLAPWRPLWLVFLLGWVIPFSAWIYLAGITVYLNHTHPELPWFDKESAWSAYNSNVLGTMHVKMPIDIFPLYTDVMAHPAHHSNVSIPVYALKEAQAELKARHGSDVKAYTLSLKEYRRIVSACKLFDYDRLCWTDFDGNPTGPRIQVRSAG